MDEQTLGEFCRKGLIKEFYSEEKDDLDTRLTEKGRQEIKKMLKDEKWQFIAKKLIEKMPEDRARNAVNNIKVLFQKE